MKNAPTHFSESYDVSWSSLHVGETTHHQLVGVGGTDVFFLPHTDVVRCSVCNLVFEVTEELQQSLCSTCGVPFHRNLSTKYGGHF
jgi:hypothetical protein